MGCLLPFVALLMPRLTLLFIALLTNWLSKAYEIALWPVLGFFLMPYTTLAYMAGVLNGGFSEGWVVLLAVAIWVDLAALHSTWKHV